MNELNSANINIILNHWSLTIQIAILAVFVIVFFALKISSQRKALDSWFYAWLFNALALTMVIIVLTGTDSLSPAWLRVFYSLYALSKITFAILMFIGLYQIVNDKNFLNPNRKVIIGTLIVCYFASLHLFTFQLLTIQISVYFIVGLIFFIGFLSHLINKTYVYTKIIHLAFFLEALMFLHHGIILIPVLSGGPLPNYMTHISFFDAILELIVGISCLFTIAVKINHEMNQRNHQLLKSQKALRKLVDKDPLTGLWHRRYFDTFLKQYEAGASVVTLQINELENINKEWGPAVGDLCLKEVAKIMRLHFNNKEGLFRINEDTFLVISPDTLDSKMTQSVQFLKNSIASNQLCAPIIILNSKISYFQQKNELKTSLIT